MVLLYIRLTDSIQVANYVLVGMSTKPYVCMNVNGLVQNVDLFLIGTFMLRVTY